MNKKIILRISIRYYVLLSFCLSLLFFQAYLNGQQCFLCMYTYYLLHHTILPILSNTINLNPIVFSYWTYILHLTKLSVRCVAVKGQSILLRSILTFQIHSFQIHISVASNFTTIFHIGHTYCTIQHFLVIVLQKKGGGGSL